MGGRPSAARPFSNHGWIMETMEMTAAELTPPRPMISRPMLVSAAFATAILLIVMWAVLQPGMPHAQIAHEAQSMSMIWIAPFALPLANCLMLLSGAILANVLGTTGAAMLLIRPYLRMNRGHLKPYHIVFFIFIVANVGGVLTPIGDPPLFLGYLSGVPFWWTFSRLQAAWAMGVGILLIVFFVFDWLDHRGQEREDHGADGGPMVKIFGKHNFLLIGLIILAVFRPGIVDALRPLNRGATLLGLLDVITSREILMIAAAVLSWRLTPKLVHKHNEFTFGPIKEVAILFFGIFAT